MAQPQRSPTLPERAPVPQAAIVAQNGLCKVKRPIQPNSYYEKTPQEFGEILTNLIRRFQALITLSSYLGLAGKGAYLAYELPQDGQNGIRFLPFKRRHLKSATSKFTKELKEFKHYFRVAKRKARTPGRPESFTGIYSPIFAGAALRALFNADLSTPASGYGPAYVNPDARDASIVDPAPRDINGQQLQNGNLMAALPRVRQGLMLRNTLTMLFYTYAHARGLQDPNNGQETQMDQAMANAFGQAPADFFSWKTPTGVQQEKSRKKDGVEYVYVKDVTKAHKIPMAEAVRRGQAGERGFPTQPLNTIQVLQWDMETSSVRPPPAPGTEGPEFVLLPGQFTSKGKQLYRRVAKVFNPAKFLAHNYQSLAACNYWSLLQLDGSDPEQAAARGYLQDVEVRQSLLIEHDTVKKTNAQWSERLSAPRLAKRLAKDTVKKQQDKEKRDAARLAKRQASPTGTVLVR